MLKSQGDVSALCRGSLLHTCRLPGVSFRNQVFDPEAANLRTLNTNKLFHDTILPLSYHSCQF